MNEDLARRLLAAADDDPILAAWSSISFGIMENMVDVNDLSSYDAWDAFEDFYSLGLITEVQYDSTSRQRFAAGKPTWDAHKRVHYRMLATPPATPRQEPPKMKKHNLGNPFDTGQSLVTQDRGAALERGRDAAALPARQSSSPSLNPFSPGREVMGPGPATMDMPSMPVPRGTSRGGLPCNEPAGGANLVRVGDHQIEVEIYCCGQRLEMMEDGSSQLVGPDELPGGQTSVIDAIFHGRCQVCQAVHHHSVGKPVPQESYR